MEEKTCTVHQAAHIANVSYSTIRQWALDFEIGIKVGGRWKILKEELDKVLSGEKHYPPRYKLNK